MTNKVETLRAILFTKEDLKNVKNLGDSFTEKDIEFMEEFKKIYELGLDQLQKFVDKMIKEGSELDTYSILYYIEVLNNGPLGGHFREMIKDKPFFANTPDTLGLLGNKNLSPQNTALYEMSSLPLGCNVDTYNKLPRFMQETLSVGIKSTERLFRSCLKSSMEIDNTLPIADKSAQTRYFDEEFGEWVLKANGSYLVKDSYQNLATNNISQKIFDNVEKHLGPDAFRLYSDKKVYDPFASKENESTSTNSKIKKEMIEGDKKELITTDLMGDVFDSVDRRGSVLKITTTSKDKYYLLNSNQGQLGV